MDEYAHEVEDPEDVKLERGFKIWQERMRSTTVRVAHCHECGLIDLADPYKTLDEYGHPMQPCTFTKYRVMLIMAQYN